MLTCQSLDFQPCILKCLFKIRDLGRAFLPSSKRGVVSAGSTCRCSYGNIAAPEKERQKEKGAAQDEQIKEKKTLRQTRHSGAQKWKKIRKFGDLCTAACNAASAFLEASCTVRDVEEGEGGGSCSVKAGRESNVKAKEKQEMY